MGVVKWTSYVFKIHEKLQNLNKEEYNFIPIFNPLYLKD